MEIHAITHVSRFKRQSKKLTKDFNGDFPSKDANGNALHFNNAFPSSSPDGKLRIWIMYVKYYSNLTKVPTFPGLKIVTGTRLVFRSRREDGFKNLYIMEDAEAGELEGSPVTRLTKGDWVDTQCQWSPSGDWIVFSSSRDKPKDAPELDNGLDAGYFAVFLVNANKSDVVVRVMGSANNLAGHVNHPFFSPDGKSIVVSSDVAAVSVDPISLPLFVHSVRPYGDIFTVDIDSTDITKNKNVTKFNRLTHSRYENSTGTWTMFSTKDPNATWNMLINKDRAYAPTCPYVHPGGGESFHMTGHLCIPKRCC